METIHPSHTPPLPTHSRRIGATTRPRCRDPPTRGPHKRGSPRVAHTQRSLHHSAHSPVGRHPQAPRDHTPLVATLQSHRPRPRGPQAPHHNDPARPTYGNTPDGRPGDRTGLPHTARGSATSDHPPHQTWTRPPPPPPGRPQRNPAPPCHTAPPSPTRGHETPQPTNTGTTPRHTGSAPQPPPPGTTPGNPAHHTPAQLPPPATTRASPTATPPAATATNEQTHATTTPNRALPRARAHGSTGRRTYAEHQHNAPTAPRSSTPARLQ